MYMNKRINLNLIILFLVFTLSYLLGDELPVYKNSTNSIDDRVSDLLSRMTLEEKVLQLKQYTLGENPYQMLNVAKKADIALLCLGEKAIRSEFSLFRWEYAFGDCRLLFDSRDKKMN